MNKRQYIYGIFLSLLLVSMQGFVSDVYGQDRSRAEAKRMNLLVNDTINKQLDKNKLVADSLTLSADSIAADNKRKLQEMTSPTSVKVEPIPEDSLQKAITPSVWKPDPTKATWMALIIPGGGQIYNKKYWKLPIMVRDLYTSMYLFRNPFTALPPRNCPTCVLSPVIKD